VNFLRLSIRFNVTDVVVELRLYTPQIHTPVYKSKKHTLSQNVDKNVSPFGMIQFACRHADFFVKQEEKWKRESVRVE
jgi:hypothetical protein